MSQIINITSCSAKFDSEKSNHFSVLSWNIMHKAFDDPTDYPYCIEEQLLWKYRLPKIKNKISSYKSDIVCLQEIDKLSFGNEIGDYFNKHHGYEYIVNIPKKSKVDHGTAIMFKNDRFECKYKDFRSRCTILLLTNKNEQLKCCKCNKNKSICIYHSFFVATVHLSAKGTASKDRMNQIKNLLNRIKHCISNELNLKLNKTEIETIRIIIIGDFNTWRPSNVCKMLLLNNNDEFKHDYQFKDAYHEAILSNFDNDLRTQKFKNNLECDDASLRIKYFPSYAAYNKLYAIDLCFYTKSNLSAKTVYDTLPQSYKDKLNWNNIIQTRIDEKAKNPEEYSFWYNLANFKSILHLPDDEWPSDHLPIGVLFEYDNLCETINKRNHECTCCIEKKPKQSSKQRKNNKKKSKCRKIKTVTDTMTDWGFYAINSF